MLLLGGVRKEETSLPPTIEVHGVVRAAEETETTLQSLIAYGNQYFTEADGWRIFQAYERLNGYTSVAWTDDTAQVVVHVCEYAIPPVFRVEEVMVSSWVEQGFVQGYVNVEVVDDCQQ